MTLCSWCGQDSQSDVICDWCKRPLPLQGNQPPPRARAELDFLREESEDRPAYMMIALVAAGVLACATLLFLLVRGQSTPSAASPPLVATNTQASSSPAPAAQQPVFRPIELEGQSLLVREGFEPRRRQPGPVPLSSATLPTGVDFPSFVKVSRAQVTLVSMPGGKKQVLGKVEIENRSERNVLDFRLELVWGPYTYVIVPMSGTARNLRPLDQRGLRIGSKMSFQVASQIIENSPEGAPHSIRLLCWLDGKPNNSLDEYHLR